LAVENRLTADELAALAPGDPVTVESGVEFARRRNTDGTVARVTNRHVVVRCGGYVECYRLRDGIRDGGAGRAELVHNHALRDGQDERPIKHIDEAYRDWTRSRSDLDRLRRLHKAIGEALEGHNAGVNNTAAAR
jgi:hypothetical protein